jgi:hypothetical protein
MRIRYRDLEWQDDPPFDPFNTKRLRRLIEVRQAAYLWGKRYIVTPRLVDRVFGNGRLLLGLSPIMFRPERFVVRVDDRWSISNWDRNNEMTPSEWIDAVYDSIEEEYVEWPWSRRFGLRWSDDDYDERKSNIDFSDGCVWWEMRWPRLRLRKRGKTKRLSG